MPAEADLTELTTVIVACYLLKNPVPAPDLAGLIASTHASLEALQRKGGGLASSPKTPPAVDVKDSVTHEYLICLQDGLKVRSLKRYLRRKYGLSPEEYRLKWSLPSDYPMVAPGYSELRSKIARQGRGQFPKPARRSGS